MLTQEQTKVITDTLHFFFCSKTTEVREERERKKMREVRGREGGVGGEKENEGGREDMLQVLFSSLVIQLHVVSSLS